MIVFEHHWPIQCCGPTLNIIQQTLSNVLKCKGQILTSGVSIQFSLTQVFKSQQINWNDQFAMFVVNERGGQTAAPPVFGSSEDPFLLWALSTLPWH